jgi:hypothetical protein
VKVVLAGKAYHLKYKKMDNDRYGEVDWENREVLVDKELEGKQRLEVTIHEALHVLFPRASEKRIDSYGIELSDMLWELGYRNEKER